jgi:hypothetical protein
VRASMTAGPGHILLKVAHREYTSFTMVYHALGDSVSPIWSRDVNSHDRPIALVCSQLGVIRTDGGLQIFSLADGSVVHHIPSPGICDPTLAIAPFVLTLPQGNDEAFLLDLRSGERTSLSSMPGQRPINAAEMSAFRLSSTHGVWPLDNQSAVAVYDFARWSPLPAPSRRRWREISSPRHCWWKPIVR